MHHAQAGGVRAQPAAGVGGRAVTNTTWPSPRRVRLERAQAVLQQVEVVAIAVGVGVDRTLGVSSQLVRMPGQLPSTQV
jgi:hypothetical protein